MTLEARLEAYLKQRWESLSDSTKRILHLDEPGNRDFLRLLWTTQFLWSETDKELAS